MVRIGVLIFSLMMVAGATNAQETSLREQVDERRNVIMDHMIEALELEDMHAKMISSIVDVYLQGLLKVHVKMPNPETRASVVTSLAENHIMLLGNHLSPEEIQSYLDAVAGLPESQATCSSCLQLKTTTLKFCGFCGAGHE